MFPKALRHGSSYCDYRNIQPLLILNEGRHFSKGGNLLAGARRVRQVRPGLRLHVPHHRRRDMGDVHFPCTVSLICLCLCLDISQPVPLLACLPVLSVCLSVCPIFRQTFSLALLLFSTPSPPAPSIHLKRLPFSIQVEALPRVLPDGSLNAGPAAFFLTYIAAVNWILVQVCESARQSGRQTNHATYSISPPA